MIPGMYASVTNVTHNVNGSTGNSGYISAAGVQEVASERLTDRNVITPYGSYSLMLANHTMGLIWYHHVLLGSKMQNQYGSTESISLDGKEICPLLTWDSKITTIVAMYGGIQRIIRKALIKENLYQRFVHIVNTEWGRVFTTIRGENSEFKLPSKNVPNVMKDFDTCQK